MFSWSSTYSYDAILKSGSVNTHRYGFQNQEEDDEIKGEGNSLNYEYRMHDPRLGRFFAIDPLIKDYPHYSPYSFSGNKLIDHIELEGAEEYHYTLKYDSKKKKYYKTDFKKTAGSSMTLKTPFGEYVAYDAYITYNGKVYHFHERWDKEGQITDEFLKNPNSSRWKAYTLETEAVMKDASLTGALILFGAPAIVKLAISLYNTPIESTPVKSNAESAPEPTTESVPETTTEPTTGERGSYAPDRKLPRTPGGDPAVDPEAEGAAHTQLGTKTGRTETYNQSREFDSSGKPVRDIDWTDHGRPSQHPNPHQHPYVKNPNSGQSLQRLPAIPLH